MRIPLLIATALLIAASPVMAKDKKGSTSGAPVFGTTKCRPFFPCAKDGDPKSMSQMEQKAFSTAKRCVKSKFRALKDTSKLFRESYGLSSGLCMKSKKQKADSSGYAFTPKCCVKIVRGKKGMCYVRCSIYGIR